MLNIGHLWASIASHSVMALVTFHIHLPSVSFSFLQTKGTVLFVYVFIALNLYRFVLGMLWSIKSITLYFIPFVFLSFYILVY